MRATPPTAELAAALTEVADRIVRMAGSVPHPERPVPATPGWTVTDVIGHVAMEPSRYRELALGRGDAPSRAADLPEFNAEQIRSLPTRDVGELADRLRSDTAELLTTVTAFGDRPPMMRFDGAQMIRADKALGTLLGEFLVHGHDIARALGRPWPIAGRQVPLVMEGLHQVMPGWVDPARAAGHTATYELRLRGLTRYVYAFRDGRLTVDPAEPARVDVRISAEPVTALLLSYGRIGQWRPALTGRLVSWGRRPWLALRLSSRFHPA